MDLSVQNARDNLRRSNWHVQALEQNFRTFVREVFIFLLDYFELQTKTQSKFRFFSQEIGQAIITIGYVFRKRLRTYFQKACVNVGDINEFQKLAGHFKLIRDECYFFRIMTRLSHIFELNMYCLEKGHNYTDSAMNIAATDDNIVFFETNGGYFRLNQTASFIAEVSQMIDAVIKQEKPKTTGLKNFVQAVECIENSNCESLVGTEKYMISLFKRSVVRTFKDVSKLDARVSKVFYNMICQHFSRVYTMNKIRLTVSRDSEDVNLNVENEKRAIVELFDMFVTIMLSDTDVLPDSSTTIHLAKYFATFRHLTDLVSAKLETEVNPESASARPSLQFDRNINSPNKYFIVPEGDMHERLYPDPHSPEKRPALFYVDDPELTRIWEELDSSIAAKNYFQLNDGRYVAYMPECKFEDDTTAVIVPTTLLVHSSMVNRQMV